MTKCLFHSLLSLLFVVLIYSAPAIAGDKLHIIYDSETKQPELKTGWGFAAMLKRGDTNILVDAGWDEKIFRHNLKESGYKPKDVDYLIISHWHPDHSGGLRYLLTENPAIVAYVPADFDKKAYPADWKLKTVSGHLQIAEGIYAFQTNPESARFGIEEELSLVIKTKQGAVIVSGCFHSGWTNLIKAVNKTISKKVYLMVGGGRFIDLSEGDLNYLAKELKNLKLENVGLAHCAAGPLPDRVFKDHFGSRSIYSRLGSVIPIPD